MTRILVTGAAGYIGSHVSLVLLEKGYEIIGIDSFENSSPKALKSVLKILNNFEDFNQDNFNFIKGDIREKLFLKEVFQKALDENKPITDVIHLAALKSVSDSFQNPIRYWEYNVYGSMNLLNVMSFYDCRNLVFSSSATVYEQSNKLLDEKTFINPNNPYGSTKAAVEQFLYDVYSSSDQAWRIINLRYFNPIGAHSSGIIGEDPKSAAANIFPLIMAASLGKLKELYVFGNDWETRDGTCIRDYIHIMDLAEGHLCALENLYKSKNKFLNINLGTGKGVTVLELISTFEKVNKTKIPFKFAGRRSGDKVMCVADNALAIKLLNWKTKRSLEDMCIDGWKWQKLNPNGYD